MSDPRLDRSRRLLVGMLLAVTVLTFRGALDAGFVWDDVFLVVQNKYVKDWKYLGRSFSTDFWDVSYADRPDLAHQYYRPLVTLSLMADFGLHGMRAAGFHFTNLLLHLAAVLLAYLLLRRILQTGPAALGAALLFALHPSRAEAVTWISGRTELLMTVAVLGALLLFWRALASSRRRAPALAGAWVCAALAVLSKESGLVLAALVPLVDWLFVSAGDRRRFKRNALWCHAPLLLAAAGYLVLWSRSQVHELVGPVGLSSLWQRAILVFESLGQYVRLVVSPYRPTSQVSPFFDPARPTLWAAVGAAVLVALLVGFVLAVRRRSPAALGVGLFLLPLVPVLNLVPLRLMALVAERFLYLPLLGVALLAGLLIDRLASRARPAPMLTVVGLAALAASWAITTSRRDRDYADDVTFWRAELARAPRNPFMEQNLGRNLVVRKEYPEAERLLMRAFLDWQTVHNKTDRHLSNLVELIDVRVLQAAADDPFPPRAAVFLDELLGERPVRPGHHPTVEINGTLLYVDLDGPTMGEAVRRERPYIHELAGTIYSELGDDARAERHLATALRLRPGRMATLMNLTLTRARAGNIAGARRIFQQAKVQGPDAAVVLSLERTLALAEQQAGQLEGWKRAAQTGSDPAAHRRLAEYYLLTRAARRALAHLREAIRLDPADRAARSVLALTLASEGERDQAVRALAEVRVRFGDDAGARALETQVHKALQRAALKDRPAAGEPRR